MTAVENVVFFSNWSIVIELPVSQLLLLIQLNLAPLFVLFSDYV